MKINTFFTLYGIVDENLGNIWLLSFVDYGSVYLDLKSWKVNAIANLFGPKEHIKTNCIGLPNIEATSLKN